ncbi:hypothetical protein HA402_012500 [Bradysia odoriphaga]|nr:hypothetical protein HA402_012500 [Bradysia odoriphaga]
MFYGELRENRDVQIVDATADVFKEFLKLFYFDKPNIEMVHIPDVLQLIRKYNVTGCIHYYDIILDRSITIDNVCWIYDLALEFQMPLSKSHCERQISLKAEEIFQLGDFLERSYETVFQIISLNNFACGEYTIFKACITWAQEECLRDGLDQSDLLNIRKQLQGLLYQIRFRSMNSMHVGDVIREYHSLFTNDELADIALIALSHSDPKTLISKEYRNNAWDPRELLLCNFFVLRRLSV